MQVGNHLAPSTFRPSGALKAFSIEDVSCFLGGAFLSWRAKEMGAEPA